MKGHAVTQSRDKYFFYLEFLDGGRWKNHFPVLFSGNMAQLMNFMGLLIFLIKYGDRVSRHPRSGKAEIVTLRNLYVNKHATCEFKISSCYSFLIVNFAIIIINNQIVE